MIISKCDLCGDAHELNIDSKQLNIQIVNTTTHDFVGKVISMDICNKCKVAIGKLDFKEVLLNATKI